MSGVTDTGHKFTTVVADTICKFIAGVSDRGEVINSSLVSTTPVINHTQIFPLLKATGDKFLTGVSVITIVIDTGDENCRQLELASHFKILLRQKTIHYVYVRVYITS